MADIIITVSGPGMVIAHEVELVHRALVAAGIIVELVDPYPPKDPAGLLEHVAQMIKQGNRTLGVKLIANHQPWGG